MKDLTLNSITKAVNGTLYANGEPMDFNTIGKDNPEYEKYFIKTISSVTTDSRKAEAGSLFFAIKGERADGHNFIPSVFEKGAMACISEKMLPGEMHPYILVESTLKALKDLAEFYRSRLNVIVVGITGSVGKTSTKETVASVLSEKYRVLKTEGNFNNEIGLPLTIFRLTEKTQVAVLEMGISDFGEMTRLSKVARPDFCIITNIGICHLENLGDREGILKAKTEIFKYLSPKGCAILNGDDDKLSTVTSADGKPVVFFGHEKQHPIFADEIEDLGYGGTRFNIHINQTKKAVFNVQVPIPGIHMVDNALAAAAIATVLSLSPEEIKAGLSKAQTIRGRNYLIHTPLFTIVDDTYNANPVSMKAALDTLSSTNTRKAAILGDMFELGENEARLHYEVGKYAAAKKPDLLITVGNLAKEIAKGARENGMDETDSIISFDSLDELFENAACYLLKGDTILVKASHGMEFAKVVDWLENIKKL